MKQNVEYYSLWEEIFSNKNWGKYPPEELVRFIGRNYKTVERNQINILETGCGPGANIWFLHREGYSVAGIDGSKSAVQAAEKRLKIENSGLNLVDADLRVGNFASLPWPDNSFDVVIDIFSIYANTSEVIEQTLLEVQRVLKPNGKFFCKLWGTKCTGYGEGDQLEEYTFDNIPVGPCANMGVSHFFDEQEIAKTYRNFEPVCIDRLTRTDQHSDSFIEEFICVFNNKK